MWFSFKQVSTIKHMLIYFVHNISFSSFSAIISKQKISLPTLCRGRKVNAFPIEKTMNTHALNPCGKERTVSESNQWKRSFLTNLKGKREYSSHLKYGNKNIIMIFIGMNECSHEFTEMITPLEYRDITARRTDTWKSHNCR